VILRTLILAAALVSPIAAFAQGNVVGTVPTTPGHAARWTAPGVIGDAGGSGGSQLQGSGYLTELGITNTGTPLGINDALTSYPYHALTLGANAIGGGVLNYQANGGAQPLPFKICVNGTCQTFPFVATQDVCSPGNPGLVPPTGGGTDGFLRADCTISSALVDTQTGPMTEEGATFSAATQPSITANQIFEWTQMYCCGGNNRSYDAVRGVAKANQNSTTTLVNAVAGYLQVDESTTGNPTGVTLFGAGAVTRDNGAIWGINTTITDNTNTSAVPSTGMGRSMYNEFDLQFTSPHSTGIGLQLEGNAVVQPDFADAANCSTLSLTAWTEGTAVPAQWNECFSTYDAAGLVAFSIGRSTNINPNVVPQANLPSQPIIMGYTNAATTPENVEFYTVAGGNQGGGINFTNTEGTLVNFNGVAIISPDSANYVQSAFTTGINTFTGTPAPPPPPPPPSGPANRPSRTSVFQYNDASSVRGAIFMNSAADGANSALQITGTGTVTEISTGKFISLQMPTSCSGQPTGTIWNNGGVAHVC
jgi:hypothetical protein